ncbi:MAG: ribonuclease III [Planctomycetes bacterium]|nr:ribonuclease III [Planctomycetota bacterium]
MESSALKRCEKAIDYTFTDRHLLELALTHSSLAPTRLASNERLEFLGDAVLGVIVCQELYQRYPQLLEGQMTKIKSAVVSRRTCAQVAEERGIAELLFLGKGMPGPGSLPQSVTAAVFEAIIGAIYLDGGLEPARRFVLDCLGPYIDEAFATEDQRNYKSMLQQHAQRRWGTTPSYHLLDEKGPDHSKCFEVSVSIGGRHFASAWGMSKKEAEQEAARRALGQLGLMDLPAEADDQLGQGPAQASAGA